MTVQIYNCETVTIRSEMIQRTKSDGIFYGLRLHMNTDQAITFWATSQDGLGQMVSSLIQTLQQTPNEHIALPGQMSLQR